MKIMKYYKPLLVAVILQAALFANGQPKLQKNGAATQLMVEGKPFLVLGGELYNSSSSSLDFMQGIWQPLRQKNLNTVLTAVSWELLEPQENKFDFMLVDAI